MSLSKDDSDVLADTRDLLVQIRDLLRQQAQKPLQTPVRVRRPRPGGSPTYLKVVFLDEDDQEVGTLDIAGPPFTTDEGQ